MSIRYTDRRTRRGVAAVELAIPLPLLVFLLLLAIDFCRIFYFVLSMECSARNGAIWACDSFAQSESPYPNVTAAAQADFPENYRSDLIISDPAPVVRVDGVDYAEVTCTFNFRTYTSYPGIAGPWRIQRKAWARIIATR